MRRVLIWCYRVFMAVSAVLVVPWIWPCLPIVGVRAPLSMLWGVPLSIYRGESDG
jgi:hypothetical protein